jgi:hypothetical protein
MSMRPVLLAAAFLLITACEDRNNPFGSGTSNSDRTPPTVVATVPSNFATQVGLSAPITVTFSEQMAMSSITATSLTFSPTIAGTLSYAGNTATFTPTAQLTPGTTYTATVGTTVKDRAGNSLLAPYTWTFSTGPTVVAGIVP